MGTGGALVVEGGVVAVGVVGVVGMVVASGLAVPGSGTMLRHACGAVGSLLHAVSVMPARAEAMNIDLRLRIARRSSLSSSCSATPHLPQLKRSVFTKSGRMNDQKSTASFDSTYLYGSHA